MNLVCCKRESVKNGNKVSEFCPLINPIDYNTDERIITQTKDFLIPLDTCFGKSDLPTQVSLSQQTTSSNQNKKGHAKSNCLCCTSVSNISAQKLNQFNGSNFSGN